MRFCITKIIFLISTVPLCSQALQAKEYDFSFDLRKAKVSKKRQSINLTPRPTSRSWRLGMQAPLLNNYLEGSGELVYGNFGDQSNAGFSDWNKYLLSMGVNGKWNDIGYGFNFYSVGRQYEGIFSSKYSLKRGRSGYDSWVSTNIDKLKVKAKYLESWTNASDNIKFQTFDNWYEIETSYPFSSSPFTELSVAYGLGKRQSFYIPTNSQTYQGSLNLFKTKFRFVADYLKFSTEIKQSSSKNDVADHKDFQREMFYFNSTLFPRHFFSIISSYRYSVDSYSTTTYKNELNRMESSLGLIYKPIIIPANLRLTSGYKKYRSENGLTHKDIYNLAAQFDWKSKGSYTGLRTDWKVGLRYKDTVNHSNPAISSSGLSFNLLWKWPLS